MLPNKYSKQHGFSIFEVLITAAIIGIITGIIVVKYGSFNNIILLKSQAYEIALDIREAQLFAVSVRGESGTFREDYGLYFNLTAPDRYLLFQDSGTIEQVDEYGSVKSIAYYDSGEEIGVPYFIDSRFELLSICVNNCADSVDDITVTFRRPDFDAQFASVSGDAYGVGTINDARITIANVTDNSIVRTIIVSPTGQVDIEWIWTIPESSLNTVKVFH